MTKEETRVMGEQSISKSFKGILRIAHILELVKNEEDRIANPTYYGKPKSLLNISGGAYESLETGFAQPSKGMDGTISRYSSSNPKIEQDDLRIQRVPMTDSMGNFLNWHIGFNGVTIGSDELINSNKIDLESFTQHDIVKTNDKDNSFIWQEKYFPILEAGHIIVGLQNKEYPTDKYKVNKSSNLILQNHKSNAQLIVENKYDKTTIKNVRTIDGKRFINYKENPNYNYRTIYTDDKSSVEKYDVFMYRQDDYDCHNFDYNLKGASIDHSKTRGNDALLNNFTFDEDSTAIPKKKTIDSHVKMVNLKEYVFDMIKKYMSSSLVEVPTGTIINQFCSLEKWYAFPDSGVGEEIGSGFPGHRPAMMAKRDAGMTDKVETSRDNPFIQSTIMGASKKINNLINTSYDFSNEKTDSNHSGDASWTNDGNLNYSTPGYYKEIIPLYKRDYVLCDGSIFAVFAFPKNFKTDSYPNRREASDRFLDLFFSIGYQYTQLPDYVNRRFKFKWVEPNIQANPTYKNAYYKVVKFNATEEDYKNHTFFITKDNCLALNEEEGKPSLGDYPKYLNGDRNALFVEDFLTILAFEKLYEKFGDAGKVDFKWTPDDISDWLSTVEIPEKYKLTSFVGDSNKSITSDNYINRCKKDYFSIAEQDKFVMELPYYNFVYDFKNGKEEKHHGDRNLPLIRLGREIQTFGDPIKFWDYNENKWVIVEAYKIPQIQYLIDLFACYPTPDVLVPLLDTYYQYNFQVPNLTTNAPSFIGSSGLQWADSQHRKVRQVESWSSSYSQKNYMHRHFVFAEPNEIDPTHCEDFINIEYKESQNGVSAYKPLDITSGNSVSGAACHDGKVLCGTTPQSAKHFEWGEMDNPNYIWNELGAGKDKCSEITLHHDITIVNGMRYPILQMNSPKNLGWTTGKYRENTTIYDNSNDHKLSENELVILKNGESSNNEKTISFTDEVWNIEENLGPKICKDKHEYDKKHWFSWEHYEDPRFDSAEPNRGRTSLPVNSKLTDSICSIRYQTNKENYNASTTTSGTNAEWFSPENIKMLPLIKL